MGVQGRRHAPRLPSVSGRHPHQRRPQRPQRLEATSSKASRSNGQSKPGVALLGRQPAHATSTASFAVLYIIFLVVDSRSHARSDPSNRSGPWCPRCGQRPLHKALSALNSRGEGSSIGWSSRPRRAGSQSQGARRPGQKVLRPFAARWLDSGALGCFEFISVRVEPLGAWVGVLKLRS